MVVSWPHKFQDRLITSKKLMKIDFMGNEDDSCRQMVSSFLADALLTVLLSVLDSSFGSVTIPTDSDVFHQCYSTMLVS